MSAINLTVLNTQVAPLWVDDPSGSGTWSLLYSCTFTLGLCVWTSIHLNVPPKESLWKSWRRRVKWLFIALFAPEVVVFTAFQQWLTAKLFLKELIKISDANTSKDLEGGGASQSKRKFDMVYAQYATMGGFAVQIGHLHNTVEQATITPSGLLFLAGQGHFFELSPGTIADKSKANLLAKSLVCFQVLWVTGQVIERKIAGYPISLLEFHTLVHVFCALVMYTLWIRKPYDVNEPTMIPSGAAEKAIAFIVSTSRWKGHSGFCKPSGLRASADPKFCYYGALETSPQIRPKGNTYGQEECSLENMDDPRINNHLMRALVDINCSVIEPGVSYYAEEKIGRYYNPTNGLSAELYLSTGQALRSGLGPQVGLLTGNCVGLSNKDLDRLDMAGTFINDILSSTGENEKSNNILLGGKIVPTDHPFNPFDLEIFWKYGRRLISYRQANMLKFNQIFYTVNSPDRTGTLWRYSLLMLAMAIIPTGYGGIHLAALHEMFPTRIEFILWKASCFTLIGFVGFLTIATIPGIVAAFLKSASRMRPVQAQVERAQVPIGLPQIIIPERWRKNLKWLSLFTLASLIWFFIIFPGTLMYIGARVFIVVESFISLRHVPIGVYQTPPTNFMGYIPHL